MPNRGLPRKQYYREHTCQQCGKIFRSARWHVKTCSNACRQKLYRQSNKEG